VPFGFARYHLILDLKDVDDVCQRSSQSPATRTGEGSW
jgi:hypothetical protein